MQKQGSKEERIERTDIALLVNNSDHLFKTAKLQSSNNNDNENINTTKYLLLQFLFMIGQIEECVARMDKSTMVPSSLKSTFVSSSSPLVMIDERRMQFCQSCLTMFTTSNDDTQSTETMTSCLDDCVIVRNVDLTRVKLPRIPKKANDGTCSQDNKKKQKRFKNSDVIYNLQQKRWQSRQRDEKGVYVQRANAPFLNFVNGKVARNCVKLVTIVGCRYCGVCSVFPQSSTTNDSDNNSTTLVQSMTNDIFISNDAPTRMEQLTQQHTVDNVERDTAKTNQKKRKRELVADESKKDSKSSPSLITEDSDHDGKLILGSIKVEDNTAQTSNSKKKKKKRSKNEPTDATTTNAVQPQNEASTTVSESQESTPKPPNKNNKKKKKKGKQSDNKATTKDSFDDLYSQLGI